MIHWIKASVCLKKKEEIQKIIKKLLKLTKKNYSKFIQSNKLAHKNINI